MATLAYSLSSTDRRSRFGVTFRWLAEMFGVNVQKGSNIMSFLLSGSASRPRLPLRSLPFLRPNKSEPGERRGETGGVVPAARSALRPRLCFRAKSARGCWAESEATGPSRVGGVTAALRVEAGRLRNFGDDGVVEG
mmetsp:Transcript_19630/g.39027  ORF Transcript_19630/g.39027 Transcript_19630/m.39027 type:complete len:137 (+) Transcript_19630:1101-1511(+)